MRWIFVIVIALHGLIHLMGFAKAFGLAEMAQLTQPISRSTGLLWLVAALTVLAAAATFLVAPRWFWLVGVCALVLSQGAISSAWSDAKFGTLANGLLLLGIILRFASHGPGSLRAEYESTVAAGMQQTGEARLVVEDDLRALPEPVQKYLRLTGSVGQPLVDSFKATWKGRIRASASDPWMAFEAEQHNFFANPPSRLFFMSATMKGLPVDVFHRFDGGSATFRVRLLSAFTKIDARGPDMNRAETVTLFNDLCILAPARLTDPTIVWEAIDGRTARAHYTRGTETITADLIFNEAGELVDFVSDDRGISSADATSFTKQRWSTPVRSYASFGPRRVSTVGEARWHAASGSYAYIELELLDIAYNLGATRAAGANRVSRAAPGGDPAMAAAQ